MDQSARSRDPNEVFDRDAAANEGYLYTKTDRLSSKMATERSAALIIATNAMRGKKVLDAGCGDGHFTLRFFDDAGPSEMYAVDTAASAVGLIKSRRADRNIEFAVGDAHRLPFADDSFDIVLLQSVLHHADRPAEMIREAFRLAPEVLIHEPNGRNPGLKLFERISSYHLEHNEKSYTSTQFRRWIKAVGGRVTDQRYGGFVPMFSPDWIAKAMKRLEPLVERVPLLREFGCAVLVIVARRGASAAA